MLRISIGQYYPAESPIHRLDPRTKTFCAIALMIATFFVTSPVELASSVVVAVCLLALARVPVGEVLESVRGMALLLCFLAVFNLLLVRGGTTYWQLGPLAVTSASVWAAVLYPVRVLVALLVGALLLLTTTPTELGDAFDAAMSPLSRVGLPGHELAMVFALMLRFIPAIADDANAIVDAQTARGGHLSSGSLHQRLEAIGSVVVALLASSMRHANDLARALDARCYVGGAKRTHWHPLRMHARDAVAFAVTAAMIAAVVAA